jgi:hypothetical protein
LCHEQDITERKQVEVEKARVAQELQTFIDTANAPIFGIDDQGQVNEWNNKAADITGFSREEVMGKDLVEVSASLSLPLSLSLSLSLSPPTSLPPCLPLSLSPFLSFSLSINPGSSPPSLPALLRIACLE